LASLDDVAVTASVAVTSSCSSIPAFSHPRPTRVPRASRSFRWRNTPNHRTDAAYCAT
jgi:hypothetical protein